MTGTEMVSVVGTVMASIGGGGVVVWGFSSVLAKVWVNRILESDRARYVTELERLKGELEARNQQLQGEIDKTIHVHRLHFETEFGALKEIYQKLAKTRRDMSSVRPVFSIGPIDQTNEEKFAELQTRFSAFTAAFDAAINAVDDNRPFLTEEIHTELSAALRAAQAEHVDVRLHGRLPERNDWYENGRKNYETLEGHLNTVVNLIRARLRVLSVYPD